MLLIIIELLNPIIYTSLIIPSLSEKISSIHEIRIKIPTKSAHEITLRPNFKGRDTTYAHSSIINDTINAHFWCILSFYRRRNL